MSAMEQPLIASPPTTVPNSRPPPAKSSNPNILVGLTIFLVVAALSMLANYEAAKGFQIVVVNAALRTHAGRRFDLLFVANGRATRLVVASSNLVRRVLYPDDSFPRKPVDRVTLYVAGEDVDGTVAVRGGRSASDFVVRMSPAVMEAADVKAAVAAAVQRGMARVWLWDGRGEAPRSLLDAMAEYVAMSSGMASPSIRPRNTSVSPFNASCWEDDDHVRLASFLHYCNAKHHGFVARLNRAMREEWTEDTFSAALGSSAPQICSAYLSAEQILRRSNRVGSRRDPSDGQVSLVVNFAIPLLRRGAGAFIATVTGYPYLNPLSSLLLTIPLHLTTPSVVLVARRAPAAEGCRHCPPYLVNLGTNPGDLAKKVNSGTNPGDLVGRVNSGTNPGDLAERVNSSTNPGDLAEKVNLGTNPGDLAEKVNSGTSLGDLVERMNSGTNHGDLAERMNSGTNPGDLAERVNSGTSPGDLAKKLNSTTNPGDLAKRVNFDTNPEDLAERVNSGTNLRDLAKKLNSTTNPWDLAEK
ncbi:hypothetical protein BHE74_00030373, partial [Ensete ventricosum]